MTKTCTKCHETKELADFHVNTRMRLGRASHCKPCRLDYCRPWQREYARRKRAQAKQERAAA